MDDSTPQGNLSKRLRVASLPVADRPLAPANSANSANSKAIGPRSTLRSSAAHLTESSNRGLHAGIDTGTDLGSPSDLLSRVKFGSRHGLLYGGKRDLNKVLGYPSTLSDADYTGRYERGDLAERIVDIFPEATWGDRFELVEDEDPAITTEFESVCQSLLDRLDVFGVFRRLDTLMGLGYYAALLIGAPGETNTELPHLSSPDDIVYLSPYPAVFARIHEKEKDTTSPRFGKPTKYSLTIDDNTSRIVHWSRIIHVAEGVLTGTTHGKPRLQSIWNRLIDLDKIVGGGSEAQWNNADPLTQYKLDPELELGEEEEKQMQAEIEELIHGLRRNIRTTGVDIQRIATAVSGFGSNGDFVIKVIAGTLGVPVRKLIGSERGELASTQDSKEWKDKIGKRKRTLAEPIFIRQFIDRLIQYGAIPTPKNKYAISWSKDDVADPMEQAEVASKLANANKAQFESGELPIQTTDEIRMTVFGAGPIRDVIGESSINSEPISPEVRQASNPSTDPSDDGWKAVHKAADEAAPDLQLDLESVFLQARDSVEVEELQNHLGSEESALSYLSEVSLSALEGSIGNILHSYSLSTLQEGARASLSIAASHGRWMLRGNSIHLARNASAPFTATFDDANPRAIEWARNHSSAQVRLINESTREAIRALIRRGIEDGIPPRVLARQIRDIIGLLPDSERAVANLISRLESAKPGDVVLAGRTEIKIPLAGISREVIYNHAARYSAKLLTHRAWMIARTETITASNRGQQELWLQARDRRELSEDQKRVWLETPDSRLCTKVCKPMHGQIRGLEEDFTTGDGRRVSNPAAHTGCRCAEGIASPEDIAAYESSIKDGGLA